VLVRAQTFGLGAQFGGKHFAVDVRVVRLPPMGHRVRWGIGVSCSADRQVKAKINRDGIFLERLEANPAPMKPSASWMSPVGW
jgi:fumarate hydratase class I